MSKTFTFIRRGGYDPQEVDDYIERLEKELESFHQREQMISNSIMDAQLTANKIIKKAEDEANHIQKDAILQLDSIRRKVSFIKLKIESFQTSYNQFIEKFTTGINHEDINKLYDQLDDLSGTLTVKKEPNQSQPLNNTLNSFNINNPTPSLNTNPTNNISSNTQQNINSKNSYIPKNEYSIFNNSSFNTNNSSKVELDLNPKTNVFKPANNISNNIEDELEKSKNKEEHSPFSSMSSFNSNLFTID